jgi:hypothetical protein
MPPEVDAQFYALFKQATVGDAKEDRTDMRGEAWMSIRGMPRGTAMLLYCEAAEQIPTEQEGAVGGAVTSTLRLDQFSAQEADPSLPGRWNERAQAGDLAGVQAMLEKDPWLLQAVDKDKMHALHWASDVGELKVVAFLLDRGADPNLQDGEGQTPLHYAVISEQAEVVSLLISRNADPNIPDEAGETPAGAATAGIRPLLR